MSAGRHELVHRLAQGYLGGLWVARRTASAPGPALALVRRITFTTGIPEEAEQRLAESAWDAMAIQHDNVLKLSEVVHAERTLDVVYEYADAQPLQSLMLRANIRRQLFPVNVTLRLIADLLLGIEAVQRTAEELQAGSGIGGLSPESVLVTRDGKTLLCDALVASTAATIEEFGRNPAKLGYTAPEQLTTRPLLPATDVFACAVLLWELLAARRFLLGPRPALERRLREHQLPDLKQALKGDREVSPALITLIDRALAADPQARPAGSAELRHELLSCGQDVCDAREVARYVTELTGTASEGRPVAEASLVPRSSTTPRKHESAPALESDESPLSEKTPVASVSGAPTLDKVAAWLDNDTSKAHWTSRSSNYRPPGAAGREAAAAEADVAPPTPPATKAARMKEKAEPSAAKPVALQSTVPRASSQPSLIPKVPHRALTPAAGPAKAGAVKSTTQPLRLSKTAPKPASQKPLGPKQAPKTITQPALPRAKAASLAPAAPAGQSPTAATSSAASPSTISSTAPRSTAAPSGSAPERAASPNTAAPSGSAPENAALPPSMARTHRNGTPPAVAVLTRPVVPIGEPLGNPPPASTEPHRAVPESKSLLPKAFPTLTGATALLEPPPLPEPSPPPPAVTPTAPLVMPVPAIVRHSVREIRGPAQTKTPTIPVSPLARARSSPPPPNLPQPAEAAGFSSVVPAVQSARDSNIPGAPPAPIVEKAPMMVMETPPSPVPHLERSLAARSRNLLLLAAAGVLSVFMLILVWLRPAEPPWAPPGGEATTPTGGEAKTPTVLPPVPAAAAPAPAALTRLVDAAVTAPKTEGAQAASTGDAGATKLAEGDVVAAVAPASRASVGEAPEAVAPEAVAPAAAPLTEPLSTGELDDDRLLATFNLESTSDVGSCRQKSVEVSKSAAKKTPKSQLVLARRALVRGQRTRAHQLLCEVSERDPRALLLQRDLTDLALRIGDAEQAQFLAERGLTRTKDDPVLLGLWGDALAETKNIPVARHAWLSVLAGADESRRAARLASSFSTLGRLALKRNAFADARRFFRRALILSQGDAAAALGYGEALLHLGESRAALVWLERASRTFPKDGQAQLLLGEALYETGDAEAARQAWKSAVSLRPNDQKLRRRIARATRERASSTN